MSAAKPERSKSRNVNAFVRAVVRFQATARQFAAKMDAIEPLRLKKNAREVAVRVARAKLTGAQMSEAERIVAAWQASRRS